MAVTTPECAADLFEALDSLDPPAGYRVEILKEEITMSPTPAGKHQRNVFELLWQIKPVLPQGYDVESYLEIRMHHIGRSTIPDLFVAPYEVLATDASHIPPDDVLLVAEVVSPTNAENDRDLKLGIYPAAMIPAYLLIDPLRATVTLYTAPENGEYRKSETVAFGKRLAVPEPFGFDLDTARFLAR
ncbi:Uma2 family endonuclease [Nocardiopsis potens]|uniref:Uma2 family endonuclease n=1 Tax=Nocardiopsis potens TaxID=1246458 RepID=UPI0003491B0B|nr:Uma2 family endonuclease [Nocardiopsis potens]